MSLNNNIDEISVYVISENQPYENWTGMFRYFRVENNIPGFYVENIHGELIKVDETLVTEVDTNLPILEFIKKHSIYQVLLKANLVEDEINSFISILNKIKIPEEWIDSFYNEMDNEIPFEGGIGFSEALTGLKISAE